MLIQSVLENVERLVHEGIVYKVIKGIAEVPEIIGEKLCNFSHWSPVLEPIEQDVINALIQKDANTESPEETPKSTEVSEVETPNIEAPVVAEVPTTLPVEVETPEIDTKKKK